MKIQYQAEAAEFRQMSLLGGDAGFELGIHGPGAGDGDHEPLFDILAPVWEVGLRRQYLWRFRGNVLQADFELLQIVGALFRRNAGGIPRDKGRQRQVTVEPKNAVLNRCQYGGQGRVEAMAAIAFRRAAGGQEH